VSWQIEQADEFREEVERYSDAERVILADAYQALVRYGPLPHPSSPLVIHRFRDPRAGDAHALVLPTIVVGYQVLGNAIVVQAADIIRRPEGLLCQLGVGTETARAHTLSCVLSVGNLPLQPAQFLELSA
jgi:hypothetical protein